MNNLFTQQGMIFVLIVAGVLIKRLNIVNDEGQKCMTNLVIDVILPCNIIKAFCIEFSEQKSNELVLVFALYDKGDIWDETKIHNRTRQLTDEILKMW